MIISVLVGGYEAIEREIDIPKRYGVDQAIGDTLTPGGIMRCLRTLPQLLEIGRDVMTHCPDAWVLNYTNPMAMLCWGMKEALPDIKPRRPVSLGAAHHGAVGASSEGATRRGRLRVRRPEPSGVDIPVHARWARPAAAHPRTRGRSELWRKDTSRMEYVKHFGFPVTEASGHNSEYSAWFRKRPELIAAYCPGGSWNGGSGFIKELYNRPDWRDGDGEDGRRHRTGFARAQQRIRQPDRQRAGRRRSVKIYGNVMNEGHIDNLPDGVCVEVPCSVDRQWHSTASGRGHSDASGGDQSDADQRTAAGRQGGARIRPGMRFPGDGARSPHRRRWNAR